MDGILRSSTRGLEAEGPRQCLTVVFIWTETSRCCRDLLESLLQHLLFPLSSAVLPLTGWPGCFQITISPGHTCKPGPYPPALEEFSNVEPYWEQMFPQMMLPTRSWRSTWATAAALLHPAVSGTSWRRLQLS